MKACLSCVVWLLLLLGANAQRPTHNDQEEDFGVRLESDFDGTIIDGIEINGDYLMYFKRKDNGDTVNIISYVNAFPEDTIKRQDRPVYPVSEELVPGHSYKFHAYMTAVDKEDKFWPFTRNHHLIYRMAFGAGKMHIKYLTMYEILENSPYYKPFLVPVNPEEALSIKSLADGRQPKKNAGGLPGFSVKIWDYDYSLAYSNYYYISEDSLVVTRIGEVVGERRKVLLQKRLSPVKAQLFYDFLCSPAIDSLKGEYKNYFNKSVDVADGDEKTIQLRFNGKLKSIQISNGYQRDLDTLFGMINRLTPPKSPKLKFLLIR